MAVWPFVVFCHVLWVWTTSAVPGRWWLAVGWVDFQSGWGRRAISALCHFVDLTKLITSVTSSQCSSWSMGTLSCRRCRSLWFLCCLLWSPFCSYLAPTVKSSPPPWSHISNRMSPHFLYLLISQHSCGFVPLSKHSWPESKHSPRTDKFLSLSYAIVTLVCNPRINNLRNKGDRMALRKWYLRVQCISHWFECIFCFLP